MKLKATLDTLDGLDAAFHSAYTEKDGKFILNVEGIKEHPDAQAVKTALDRTRQEKKDLEAKLGVFDGLPEDFNLEAYNKLVDSAGGDIDKKLSDQRERLTKESTVKIEKLTTERDSYKSRVEKLAGENEISKALTEAKVAPHMQKAVRAMFQSQIKVDFEGEQAIATIENLPVVDKIKAWAGTEEGKYFVAADHNGGGGGGNPSHGGGNKSDNPWHKDSLNFTKQIEIEKSDPQKAAQLKGAAGK